MFLSIKEGRPCRSFVSGLASICTARSLLVVLVVKNLLANSDDLVLVGHTGFEPQPLPSKRPLSTSAAR
jgi:hypothetical protein